MQKDILKSTRFFFLIIQAQSYKSVQIRLEKSGRFLRYIFIMGFFIFISNANTFNAKNHKKKKNVIYICF